MDSITQELTAAWILVVGIQLGQKETFTWLQAVLSRRIIKQSGVSLENLWCIKPRFNFIIIDYWCRKPQQRRIIHGTLNQKKKVDLVHYIWESTERRVSHLPTSYLRHHLSFLKSCIQNYIVKILVIHPTTSQTKLQPKTRQLATVHWCGLRND